MFWKNDAQTKRLPGPKGIPDPVGRYLVTQENMSPNLVWTLMAVMIPRSDEKDVIDVRVYDSNKAAHNSVIVKNYHSLDDHPALVIFDGWYNKIIYTVGKRKL
jgi:hypothetical protein